MPVFFLIIACALWGLSELLIGGTLLLAANVLMQWKRPPHLPPVGPIP